MNRALRLATVWLKQLLGIGDARGRGATSRAHAKVLVEREQRYGARAPDGCEWLAPETVVDLEMESISGAIDRTLTPLGAQQLWRMVVGPAQRMDVLERRENILRELIANDEMRRALKEALAEVAGENAAFIPHILWGDEPRTPVPRWVCAGLPVLLISCIAGVALWPKLILLATVVLFVNVLVDHHIKNRIAHQADALVMLGRSLAVAQRICRKGAAPSSETELLAADVSALSGLRRRMWIWAVDDPTSLVEIIQSVLLIRANVLASCLPQLASQRERLRRVHGLVGELDALLSIVTLRQEQHGRVTTPLLESGAPHLEARDLRHPALQGAVGNDLGLEAQSLVITGSNMAGKSTFMRTLATNAILAQSIHTVWGSWRACLFRVHAAMRAADDTQAHLSTYAAEVANIGRLVRAAGSTSPALFVVDEPFRGTDPVVRVPMVVAVLEYLATSHVVIAATHDLDAATRLPESFLRGCFSESGATFDYRLRQGTVRSTNAVELLRRADYPAQITDAVERATKGAHARSQSL